MNQLQKLQEVDLLANILDKFAGVSMQREGKVPTDSSLSLEYEKLTGLFKKAVHDLDLVPELSLNEVCKMIPVTPDMSHSEASRRREIIKLALEKETILGNLITKDNLMDEFDRIYNEESESYQPDPEEAYQRILARTNRKPTTRQPATKKLKAVK